MTTPTNPPTPAPTPTIKRLKEELTGRNQDYGIVAELVDTLEFELAQAQAALAAKDDTITGLRGLDRQNESIIAAKEREIEKLKADGAASAFVDMAVRAEKAEVELARFKEYAFGMESALRGARASGTASETALFRAESAELRLLNDQLRAEVNSLRKKLEDQHA